MSLADALRGQQQCGRCAFPFCDNSIQFNNLMFMFPSALFLHAVHLISPFHLILPLLSLLSLLLAMLPSFFQAVLFRQFFVLFLFLFLFLYL